MSLVGRAVDLVSGPWRLYAELVAGAALVALCGTQTWRLHSAEARAQGAKAETAVVRGQWATQAAAAASAGFAASERYRALEGQMNRQREEAEHARQIDREASQRMAAGFAAERAGMRRDLAAYAVGTTGGGGLTVDTVAACRQRAATLGDSLAEALRAEEDATADLELSRADTRSLLDAWPWVTPH